MLNQDQQEQLKEGAMGLQDGAIVSQVKESKGTIRTGGVKKNYLYADTCSTNDFMVNPAYLTGVYTVGDSLHTHTNAGTCVTKKQGFLGSTPFWLDRNGIANVVSLRSLESKHRVTYNSTPDEGAFVVHTPEGKVYFCRCPDTGFPYIDLDDASQGATLLLQSNQQGIPTIRANYEGFTSREISKVRDVRDLQARLGQLSATKLQGLLRAKDKVSHSILHNCSVTSTDFDNANTLFGPSIDRLKGTMVRVKPIRIEPNYVNIPAELWWLM